MAINRKKRNISVNRSKLPPAEKKAKVKKEKPEKKDIAKTTENNTPKLKVVSGTRHKRKIINIVSCALVAAIIIIVIIINVLSPTGIIELMQNGYAAMGSGSYPVNIYSQNALSFDTNGDVLCLVNASYFEVYNDSGKLIQAVSHGMSNPRIEASEARFLLFDRERYSVKLYNYSDELYERSFENVIVSAAIGRDGTYAVVTNSNSYLNTVYVFDKDNELVYTWNSANYYVADVAVAEDGDRIAVCLVGAENGAFVSKVYCLEFDSATPVNSFSFDILVSSIMPVNDNYFMVNSTDSAYILKWDKASSEQLFISNAVRCYAQNYDGYSCIAYGRENNEQINSICVIDQSGKVKTTFSFNSRILDISISEDRVAVLSDNAVYVYTFLGEQVSYIETEVKPLFITSTDNGVIAVDSAMMRVLND